MGYNSKNIRAVAKIFSVEVNQTNQNWGSYKQKESTFFSLV